MERRESGCLNDLVTKADSVYAIDIWKQRIPCLKAWLGRLGAFHSYFAISSLSDAPREATSGILQGLNLSEFSLLYWITTYMAIDRKVVV